MSSKFDPDTISEILERIARAHTTGSEEYLSIELAAKAILFIHASGQSDAFRAYIESMGQALTDDQKKFLAAIGLE